MCFNFSPPPPPPFFFNFIWKMKKQELANKFLKTLKSRDDEVKVEPVKVEYVKAEPVQAEPFKVEPVKVEPIKKEEIAVNFENFTRDELIYDINAFLDKQNKGMKGINSKTKPFLLNVIKELKTKHYTEAERKQIAETNQNELNKNLEIERLEKSINKYITLTNNHIVAGEYFKSNKKLEELKEIISKYSIDTYDSHDYDNMKKRSR